MDAGSDHRPGEQQRSTDRESRSKSEASGDGGPQPAAPNGCFDCSICLEYAVEPVVTLCGHLYCWPCIYKWLRQDGTTPRQCPVCKAALSPAALVPLYGRRCSDARAGRDVPRRPSTSFASGLAETAAAPHAHRRQILDAQRSRRRPPGNYMVSSSSRAAAAARLLPPTMLGGTAVAVLPWVLGDEWMGSSYLGSHHPIGGDSSPRLRRQEMHDRISLHRISIFLFCCLVLCLLVF